jgi:hypothetical protein
MRSVLSGIKSLHVTHYQWFNRLKSLSIIIDCWKHNENTTGNYLHEMCTVFQFLALYFERIALLLANKNWEIFSCTYIINRVLLLTLVVYIEDITRPREDVTFYLRVVKTIFYERAQRVSKILFLTREDNSHIFKPPCNVLFII